MFEIFAETHFAAGHHLRDYPGNCEHPHGHNWKVRVTVSAPELDALGMGIDFRRLKEIMREALADLDHRDLNSLPEFAAVNPSSENIARLVYQRVEKMLGGGCCRVACVTVRETDDNGVSYFGADAAAGR